MRKKILIIEDDLDVRENIITLLSEEGYNVIPAKDGKTGIKITKEENPSLIICDIMMNGLSGYDVLDALSKDNSTKTIPFIFLTAKTDREDIRLGMLLGADDYLVKPYNSDELLKSIETRLRKAEGYKKNDNNLLISPPKEIYSVDDKIFVRADGNPTLIKIVEIMAINAENQYSTIRMLDGKTYLIRKSLSHWESILPQKNFIRIHRSTIINLNYLIKIDKWYNASLIAYLKDIKEPFVISKKFSTKIRKKFI
ncbi:MAG: response regulator [Ignavibacteriaceae bacterium]|jgi:DNA-binding response OmpR family regulator